MREVARYLIELGSLKRIPRAGWGKITSESVESVAEHCHRATVLGYALATLEGANPDRVASLLAFHDAHETRMGDLTPQGKKYLHKLEEAEGACLGDQIRPLPQPLRSAVLSIHEEYRSQETMESRIARDADRLDCALQALELVAQGRNQALELFERNLALLKTPTAQGLGAFLVSELRAGRLGALVAWWKDGAAGRT
jgi:putative hydrolase of HD superfamily